MRPFLLFHLILVLSFVPFLVFGQIIDIQRDVRKNSLELESENTFKKSKRYVDFVTITLNNQRKGVLKNAEEITVPIFFHIINSPKDEIKISKEDLDEQLNVLNLSFSGFYDKHEVDTKIRFCFMDSDLKKDGYLIYAEDSTLSFDQVINKESKLKGINPDSAINIWIFDFNSNLGGLVNRNLDSDQQQGIYINKKFFGERGSQKYREGKTLVHLMGRYLSLEPLWGNTKCEDDGVLDTPIHNAPNFECMSFGHRSTCGKNIFELTNNFMDALPDECAKSFTRGQAQKMYDFVTLSGFHPILTKGNTKCP
jgi:hypothetical protein